VFEPVAYTSTATNSRIITSSVAPDSVFWARRNDVIDKYWYDRLRGNGNSVKTNTTQAENGVDAAYGAQFNSVQTGYAQGTSDAGFLNSSTYTNINYLLRRAPGFFDVVCYTGTGSQPNNVPHNLGVKPELIFGKKRNGAENWGTWFTNGVTAFSLNSTSSAILNNPVYDNNNASTFDAGLLYETSFACNDTADTYVAYLFATCPGVSKVGSYTGTGATLQIDCGFAAGARFVLIKRTDSTGDWYVWDSARGIVAGNDPYLLLNSTAAEVTSTDWVDTYSLGFELSNAGGNNVNINTASYIYLSIA
jgi:hypothetical protein